MMDYDSRTVFERWMQKGYEYERDGRYTLASSRYKDAYKVAKMFDDEAQERAKESADRCDKKLEEVNEY